MKILYVLTGLAGGGAEKVVVELADQMLLQGHLVKIAYLKGDIVVSPKQNIEIFYLGLESFKNLRTALLKYHHVIQDFQPDVVHAHMVHANIFTRLSRIFVQVPKLINSAHSNNEGGVVRMLSYRLTNSLTDVFTNVSHNAVSSFEALGAVKSHGMTTVYNGIDLSRFERNIYHKHLIEKEYSINSDCKIFISIGRLHESKDFPNLLNAFAKLKHQHDFKNYPIKLLIVGEGEMQHSIEKLILTLDLESDVILLGRRNDIANLLNLADFFVLSSKYEGLPTVIIEAMACQTFVIATDCGGSAEIMQNTGKLVPIEDSSKLALAMKDVLMLDQNSLNQNNDQARLIVEEKFSLTCSVQRWLKIYATE